MKKKILLLLFGVFVITLTWCNSKNIDNTIKNNNTDNVEVKYVEWGSNFGWWNWISKKESWFR